jgi:hypothetical protein
MLHLQACVHLEEEELAALVVDDELYGARRVVADRARELGGRRTQAVSGGVR